PGPEDRVGPGEQQPEHEGDWHAEREPADDCRSPPERDAGRGVVAARHEHRRGEPKMTKDKPDPSRECGERIRRDAAIGSARAADHEPPRARAPRRDVYQGAG